MLHVEQLEDRQALATLTLSGGVLTVTGHAAADGDHVILWNDGSRLYVEHGTKFSEDRVVESFPLSAVPLGVDAVLGAGDDYLVNDSRVNLRADAGAGNDYLKAGRGSDVLRGGDGYDYLQGGAGACALFGDGGDDYLQGGFGPSVMFGGAGHDTFRDPWWTAVVLDLEPGEYIRR